MAGPFPVAMTITEIVKILRTEAQWLVFQAVEPAILEQSPGLYTLLYELVQTCLLDACFRHPGTG